MSWWSNEDALQRFIIDLLTAELARLRIGENWPPLDLATTLDTTGIGIDSLELMTLATAVAEALQLGRAGIDDYLLAHRRIADWIEISAQGLDRYSETMVFRTSGTTGPAKACRHTLADLWREIETLAVILGPYDRILSGVPSHHIYGFLFTILLPKRLGVPVMDIRAAGPWGLASLSQKNDLIIGHPLYWNNVARAGANLAPATAITSAGKLNAATGEALRDLGIGKIIEIYGSSETAGIGWRQLPDRFFLLFPYWRRDGASITSLSGSYPLPDQLAWQDATRFEVLARIDGGVKIGGITVNPEHIRIQLCTHPGVRDAAVRPILIAGHWRTKAFIVPIENYNSALLDLELRHFAETTLAVAERPRSYTYGSALPVDALGKAADWD